MPIKLARLCVFVHVCEFSSNILTQCLATVEVDVLTEAFIVDVESRLARCPAHEFEIQVQCFCSAKIFFENLIKSELFLFGFDFDQTLPLYDILNSLLSNK